MFWIEMKKNTFSTAFLVAIILMLGFTFISISPEVEYYYSKPLSPGEFIYFKLKEDIRHSSMVVYGGEEGNGIPVDLNITDEIRANLKKIIIEINPMYDEKEKMSNVKIKLTDNKVLELINNFEKTIGYRTNYHYGEKSGLYSVYRHKRFGINRTHEDNRNTIEEETNDFNYSLRIGLSEGYARYFMNYLGILAGLISAVISATIFIKDRQNHVTEMLYVSNSKSSKIVFTRIISVVMPISSITLLISIAGAIYFHYELGTYGYHISYIPFIKYWLIWIVPTILIMVALSVFLDIWLNNVFIVIGTQFIIWLLSIATFIGNYEFWRVIIRFSSFGIDNYYDSVKNEIYINRIFMLFLSIIVIIISIIIFDRNRRGRTHEKKMNKIKNFLNSNLNINESKDLQCKSRNFLAYQFKFAFRGNILISLLFLLLLLVRFMNRDMNEYDVKTTGENIIIFFSMFILLPMCNIENKNNVAEFTYTCKISYIRIFFTRFIIGIMITLSFIIFSLYLMSAMNNINFGWWFLSICISSVYLGLFGVIFSEISGRDLAGYIAYLGYYLFCAIGKKNLALLNVCCYTNELRYSVISLIAGIYIMLVILFFIIKGKELGKG
ncbi:ABC transporter permease [Catonella massiliensis]|uniref:ABC transporter permease n=1 Tax=Catonella massiliensis TaxID=2799636 RepID=A0ABS1J2J0_9FIRM|nr:hypothetical protein [Catonella massiliensis]MBK5898371.1 hypothetical protein [Catonella massiliensis]